MPQLSVATIPVTAFQQNCTLVWDTETRRAVVIDPGGDAARIMQAVAQQSLVVEAIWLTHGHLDHAGGAEALRAALGVTTPIIGPHRADAFLLQSIEQQAAQYGLPGLANATPDRWLEEGQILMLGEHRFDILHCPGHTPGHIVFVNARARFAQVGDVLFAGSVGRTDFPYGDEGALIAAIKAKLLPLGDDMAFICGHGEGSTIGEERLTNPYLR